MNVLVFGTYEAWRYPRVRVLIEGFRAHGDAVTECNVPLGIDTAARMDLLRRPWRAVGFIRRLLGAWNSLRLAARGLPAPDVVLVPYMGHFDVHLARRIWPHTPIVLDHLISAAGTARDRGVAGGSVHALLRRLDGAALVRADLAIFDTAEHLDSLAGPHRARGMVVPVGAPQAFFAGRCDGAEGAVGAVLTDREPHERLRVGFFGIYTPLHGTRVIAEAIARLAAAPIDFVMVGSGQEHEAARAIAAPNRNVTWIDWIALDEFPAEVRRWDVCLGIFATTTKALSVVPHKVFIGAASGCAIVTADTPPQRNALGDAACYVPPADAEALATALAQLAADPGRVRALQRAAFERACLMFSPRAVVAPLLARLREMS